MAVKSSASSSSTFKSPQSLLGLNQHQAVYRLPAIDNAFPFSRSLVPQDQPLNPVLFDFLKMRILRRKDLMEIERKAAYILAVAGANSLPSILQFLHASRIQTEMEVSQYFPTITFRCNLTPYSNKAYDHSGDRSLHLPDTLSMIEAMPGLEFAEECASYSILRRTFREKKVNPADEYSINLLPPDERSSFDPYPFMYNFHFNVDGNSECAIEQVEEYVDAPEEDKPTEKEVEEFKAGRRREVRFKLVCK